MPRYMRLYDQDKAALRKLDNNFEFNIDGERAVISGEMEVEIVRPANDGGARLLAHDHISRRRRTRRSGRARSVIETA